MVLSCAKPACERNTPQYTCTPSLLCACPGTHHRWQLLHLLLLQGLLYEQLLLLLLSQLLPPEAAHQQLTHPQPNKGCDGNSTKAQCLGAP